MQFLKVVVFIAGLCLGTSTLSAEERVEPDKTTEPKPVKENTSRKPAPVPPDKAAAVKSVQGAISSLAELLAPENPPEVKPEDGDKKSPFSPSTLMRIRAQKPVENTAIPAAAPTAPVVRMRPVLEGVLVKNNTVLASFRVGNKSIVVEPRNILVVDDVKYTFVGYADEIATLRDEDGQIHDLRVVQQASSNPTPPHAPEPNSTK